MEDGPALNFGSESADSFHEVAQEDGAGEPGVNGAVFQVLAADGEVAGTGFLAGEDTAFTCAHVVRAAGGAPGGRVEVVFANLPDMPRVWGRVPAEGWRAPEAEDIAVLRLEEAPTGARGLPVGAGAGCRGHRVFSFGFPAQAPAGGHFGYGTAGELLAGDRGAGRLLQLAQANDLTTGFSGGPVVDEMTGLVIGMVTSIVSPDAHLKGLGIAYATPAEVLREVRPQLAEHQVCPYLGLEPFTAQHAEWFHGREAAVEGVLAVLGESRRMVMLLGPSGGGKSSLINAGVLPALADGAIPGSDRWLPVYARPGQNLLAQLETAGLPGACSEGLQAAVEARLATEPGHDRLLLVIDQFEELLTRPVPAAAADDVRLPAADQLVALAGSSAAVTVLLVMRNDFYAPLGALAPDLMDAVFPGMCNIPATLGRPDLKAIIARPAAAVGLSLEPGLAERIANDVLEAGPAARQASVTLLPPLELALRQLWLRRRRDDGRLTHAAYEKVGGVAGSMTAWCNRALGQLPPAHRPTAQGVLTALVRPADEKGGIPGTRQLVTLTRLRALAADPQLTGPVADAAFDAVLAALTRYRIITTGTPAHTGATPGEPAAELIHDALIRDWADLRDWVSRDQRFQVWLHRAAEQEERRARSGLPGDLLDGSLFTEGQEWAARRPLPAEISALLDASRQHQQAAIRRTRRINAFLVGMLALALIAAGIAFYQQHTATTAQHVAQSRQLIAQSRQLAAQSTNLQYSDPDLASLLAVKAWRTRHTREAAAALYTAPAAPLRHRLKGHKHVVISVAFSPDGKTLATGSFDNTVRLWETKTGKTRTTLKDHKSAVTSMAFSPDGKTLATGSDDSTVRLRDPKSGKTRTTLNTHDEPVGVDSVAFSPDGKTFATGSGEGTVRLWDPDSGKTRATLKDTENSVDSVAFSPGGKTFATGSSDGTVRLLDSESGKTRATLKRQGGIVNSVAFSPDGKTLATGSNDGIVRLLDSESGKTRATLKRQGDVVNSVAFSPRRDILATGSSDGTVRLWDLESKTTPTVLEGHEGSVESVAFSPDGKTLATGSRDRTVRLWDAESGTTRTTLKGHNNSVTVAFSPDGKTLASNDGTVRLWDPESGKLRTTLNNGQRVWSVAFSPDSKTLATGSDDGTVRLWDSESGKTRAMLKDHKSPVASVVFSLDGKSLATGSYDGAVRLWDPETGRIRITLKGHKDPVTSVAFSPDGKTLVTGDGTVRLLDPESGRTRTTLHGYPRDVTSVAFSPDGKTLAAGNIGGGTRLLDPRSGKLRTTLKSNGQPVWSVAFGPDGEALATGSGDGAAHLWDPESGKARTALMGHEDIVESVMFSSDGKTLATGSADGTARLWNVDLRNVGEISRSICVGLKRNFTRTEQSTYLRGQNPDPVCPD